MTLNTLNAITPIDGRYYNKTNGYSNYFSEKALIKYRVLIEIEYFLALTKTKIPVFKNFPQKSIQNIKKIYLDFSQEDAITVKEIEKETNHDVKAVEYFIKKKFKDLQLDKYLEYIHFGLTSQDINNTAVPLSIKDALSKVYLPELNELVDLLSEKVLEYNDISMLARTHGQPASPTRLGKEINVFKVRINEQLKYLHSIPFAAKFGGATGNFNAHVIAFPSIDWKHFANKLVTDLGLYHSFPTTQIEHYDHLASLFDCLKRINTIIIDFNRDLWSYISMDYFKQKINKKEVGSSAMPHKVNPIDFENSEGNLGLANALFEHLSSKLPVSRLQRDLTDSTVLRNVGVPFSHSSIAIKSTIKGINKLIVNKVKIENDLNNNWAIIAEAIQTILRREGYPNPYETLKELTRKNTSINRDTIHQFIDTLNINIEIKNELKKISPSNYTGL
ncbi:MAG: adenylosuccinate lyase [Flavobacteriaceae bacterium]|nr:adenylosuccinate lyase [Flavobacteriaceae bacterium]MDG1031675.1 adenylosuccinate lyase [Flavobacteriaceae bacterium]MDG1344293.1 adenylosuccinate lyase [Flavobacteriaceae bacterium]MDG2485756.1 adenylosuccinate lyase [Flavobacteriaceae bacterium]